MTAIVKKDATLAQLEAARAALAKVTTLEEVKRIADYAEAMRVVGLRRDLSGEIAHRATRIKAEALVREGEILAAMKAQGARAPRGGDRRSGAKSGVATLKDLGVSRQEASQAEAFLKNKAAVTRYFEKKDATIDGFKRAVLTPARRQERLGKIAAAGKLEGGPWSVFYADPAWEYEQGGRGAAENHYPTMPLAAICALPVREHTTPDAALFLWSTTPMIPDALRVIAAWGFDFKTGLVWVKPNAGTGQYVRGQHEHLFIATRGAMATPAEPHRPPSVVRAPAGKHSEKPAVFAEIIERMYPGQPRIELFARGPVRKGWAAWGNEVGRAA